MPFTETIEKLPFKSQSDLWKHMTVSCAVPLMSREEYRNRQPILRSLLEQVNDGSYAPQKLHGFLSTPKAQGVARFVPVFPYADTAIYFSCLQQVDSQLAAAAVPETFGGWQLGGARRSIEEQEALRLFGGEDSFSIPVSCYNRGAWVKQWNQFWKLLAARHEDADDSAWFSMFDIANFYDSVDLRRLETSVRAAGGGAHFPINVLFHLLRSWNKAHCLYTESTKGLPMDIVGDCSRLLANYFLTPFDRQFREFVLERGGHYMRFADDMVIRAASKRECMDLVYHASDDLHRLGLNINVAKVRYCSKKEFNQYWGFVIMDHFESGELVDGLNLLKTFIQDDVFGRRATALKRAVTLISKADDGADTRWWKAWVREFGRQEELPLYLSREQLLAYISLYDDAASALEDLSPVFTEQPFSQPKAIFMRVLGEFKRTRSDRVQDVCATAIDSFGGLNDSVLNLCLKGYEAAAGNRN